MVPKSCLAMCEGMDIALQEMGWKRSDYVVSTKIFWGGSGPNDKGLSRKHIVEGTRVTLHSQRGCFVGVQ